MKRTSRRKGTTKDTKVEYVPMNITNTRCKIFTVEACGEKGLTPLVTYKDKALVPDWEIIMNHRVNWKKEFANLQKEGFAYLSGQQLTDGKTEKKPEAMPDPLFDLSGFTRVSMGGR